LKEKTIVIIDAGMEKKAKEILEAIKNKKT
jgi:hypothetical protein